jgi:hypothetical protein
MALGAFALLRTPIALMTGTVQDTAGTVAFVPKPGGTPYASAYGWGGCAVAAVARRAS